MPSLVAMTATMVRSLELTATYLEALQITASPVTAHLVGDCQATPALCRGIYPLYEVVAFLFKCGPPLLQFKPSIDFPRNLHYTGLDGR